MGNIQETPVKPPKRHQNATKTPSNPLKPPKAATRSKEIPERAKGNTPLFQEISHYDDGGRTAKAIGK